MWNMDIGLIQRRRLKRLLSSPVTAVVFLVVAAFLLHATWGVYKKERESRLNRERAEELLGTLQAREKTLAGDIEKLKTDRGLEEEIRERFPVAREGEEVVVIVEPVGDASAKKALPAVGFWERLKRFFK